MFTKKFTKNIVDLGKGIKLVMVNIPGGSFMMGSPDTEAGRCKTEGPQHKVTLEPFSMGIYPITQEQYQEIMGYNPSDFTGRNRPVGNVSWFAAMGFCLKLSEKTGVKFSLPSESQWEYACRAGTTTPFNCGNIITTDLANYNGSYHYGNGPKGEYRGQTTDVGSFPPNRFGLYDMHGNVLELCADDWHPNYNGAPTDGSVRLKGDDRLTPMRGGCWDDPPEVCRSASRDYHYWRVTHFDFIGFRVVCDGGRTR